MLAAQKVQMKGHIRGRHFEVAMGARNVIQYVSKREFALVWWLLVMGWTSLSEHTKDSNLFIFWWSNSNNLFLASNERTWNILNTRFAKLPTKQIGTSYFWTLDRLEHVQCLVMELKCPTFGIVQSIAIIFNRKICIQT